MSVVQYENLLLAEFPTLGPCFGIFFIFEIVTVYFFILSKQHDVLRESTYRLQVLDARTAFFLPAYGLALYFTLCLPVLFNAMQPFLALIEGYFFVVFFALMVRIDIFHGFLVTHSNNTTNRWRIWEDQCFVWRRFTSLITGHCSLSCFRSVLRSSPKSKTSAQQPVGSTPKLCGHCSTLHLLAAHYLLLWLRCTMLAKRSRPQSWIPLAPW